MKEITKIDFDKLYFKVTNEDEIHYGLAYHDGIVTDILPFNGNPDKTCCPGRIYITDAEHLAQFFEYGKWVRPCYIEGKEAIIAPDGNKIGVHAVKMLPRMTFVEWFDKYKQKIDYDNHSWKLAEYLPERYDDWKNKFNYDNHSFKLAEYLPERYDDWKNKFNYEKDSWILAQYLPERYDDWKDKFNYDEDSLGLAQYLPERYDDWKDKFNYDEESWALARYLPERYEDWEHRFVYREQDDSIYRSYLTEKQAEYLRSRNDI